MSSSQVEVKPPDGRRGEWHSIGGVARLFGLNPSTLRYWEEQGLIVPAARESGRRLYDRENLRRIALIVIGRDTGLMELAEIHTILDGPASNRTWRDAVQSRLHAIQQQRERLATAQAYLEHLLTCPSDHPAQTCPYLAAEIDQTLNRLEREHGDVDGYRIRETD